MPGVIRFGTIAYKVTFIRYSTLSYRGGIVSALY